MTVKNFLAAKALSLCFLGIGALLLLILFLLVGVQNLLIACMLVFFVLLVALWLLCDFYCTRARLKRLTAQAHTLTEKYLLGELLPQPANPIERQYFTVMRTVSHAAITAVEDARREAEEYQDYVESWIHEIKTPLTACSLILANGGDARKLKRELKRADNLTESILYYARLRSAALDRKITAVQANTVIEEALQSQMELLTAAGIGAQIQGDCTLHTDPKALCFMLKQMLLNCAKYCPHCNVSFAVSPNTIILTDNGIGILPQELPRIWSRGFTGSNGRSNGSSTGMGLYLVHSLCEQLGITLTATSVPGQYTSICLEFKASLQK